MNDVAKIHLSNELVQADPSSLEILLESFCEEVWIRPIDNRVKTIA